VSSGYPVFCFDLDDTLVSESDYVESGLWAAGALVDAEAPGAEAAGEWLVAAWRRERPRDGFQQLLRRRRLDEAAWLPRLVQVYRAHAPALAPRRGVGEVLPALMARGARLALLSDGDLDVQRRKWTALALPYPFDPVVFTGERGREYWKPHSWGFERVMAAHAGASRFLYVGDNPAKDFIAPNRLGWVSVLVRHPQNLHPAHPTSREGSPGIAVDSLDALLELT
jgi:putative hydrolase of the HAD superfamily